MMERKQKSPAARMLLLLIPILLAGGGFAAHDITGGSRIGSSTEYGEVYALQIGKERLYEWIIYNDSGMVSQSGMTDSMPYIFAQDDKVVLVESNGLRDEDAFYTAFDLHTGAQLEDAPFRPMLDPLTITRHIRSKKISVAPEFQDHVQVRDISVPNLQRYLWYFPPDDEQRIWPEFSETEPVISGDGSIVNVRFTEDGELLQQSYWPETGRSTYDCRIFEEDGREVLVEQAIDTFDFAMLWYDEEQAQTDGFLNTDTAEIADLNDAYDRAKAEVSIPYDLVTFRAQPGSEALIIWEVTFSQNDRTDGDVQTVYLDQYGTTILILHGSPATERSSS